MSFLSASYILSIVPGVHEASEVGKQGVEIDYFLACFTRGG